MKKVYSIGNLYIENVTDAVVLRIIEGNKNLSECLVRDEMLHLIKAVSDIALYNYLEREIQSYQNMIDRRQKDVDEEEAFIKRQGNKLDNKAYYEEKIKRFKDEIAAWERKQKQLIAIRDSLLSLVYDIIKWEEIKHEQRK
ncbi:MAG: hypothetical protein QXH20_02565 [Candidatus Bathyarchaeia archaeon]